MIQPWRFALVDTAENDFRFTPTTDIKMAMSVFGEFTSADGTPFLGSSAFSPTLPE
jgi:hypothetical protein